MKKLVIGMAAALALTGCAGEMLPQPTGEPQLQTALTEAVTEETALETTQPQPTEKAYYQPDSPTERSTDGAVWAAQMDASVTGLAVLGDRLVVCTEGRTLHLLEGDTLREVRVRELDTELAWGGSDLQVTATGLGFYEDSSSTYVTLDENLVTGPSYVVPATAISKPLMASDLSAIYFITQEGIQRMDLKEGTSRVLRQERGEITRLGGLMFENSVLYYTRLDPDGMERTCFVDADSGSLCRTNTFRGQMASRGTHFSSVLKVSHTMGEASWVVTGNKYGRLRMLELEEGWAEPILLENGYVILQSRSQLGLELLCFDVVSEQQIARVLMPQQYNLFAYGSIDENEVVWLCDGSSSRFYGWRLGESRPGVTEAVMRPYASLEHPDREKMQAVEQEAQELAQQMGVELHLVQQGHRTDGISYGEFPDFQPIQYRAAVRKLEETMSRLPAELFRKMDRKSGSGTLTVELVDSYDPAYPVPKADGAYSVEGGIPRISVGMCPELGPVFYHELFHVMEVQIRNSGDGLKDWDKLNPPDFSYLEDPSATEESRPPIPAGKNITADRYGLTDGREDRAQIFMYACMDGQQTRFESGYMQQKLRLLCAVIRQTYELEETPIWEQYLLPEEPEPTAVENP